MAPFICWRVIRRKNTPYIDYDISETETDQANGNDDYSGKLLRFTA